MNYETRTIKETMPKLLPLRDEWFKNHPRPASKETYERHLRTFMDYCQNHKITDISGLTDNFIMDYPPTLLRGYSASSVNLKIVVLKDFLGYLADRNLLVVNWGKLERQWRRLPRGGRHQVQLDDGGIEQMIEYCLNTSPKDVLEARNFAFIVFLADTGLRVHEACKLKRGDIDWRELHGVIVGKGKKQASFRISERAARLTKRYLDLRAQQDGSQKIELYRLPVFARHDDAAGKAIKHMSTTTGRNITADMVMRVLGSNADPQKPITPHRFRHFLIDRARKQGGITLAKGLARHASIKTTEGYFHLTDEELDRGYKEMFNRESERHE
jgi:integrase/recombinase XerC